MIGHKVIVISFLIIIIKSDCQIDTLSSSEKEGKCIYYYDGIWCSHNSFKSCQIENGTTITNQQKCNSICGKGLSKGAIAGIVIGSVFTIAIIIFIAFKIRKSCIKQKQQDIEAQQYYETQQNLKKIDFERKINVFASELTRSQSRINLKNQSCPICFEDSPNLMLSCSHFYHKKCVYLTLMKKLECTICNNPLIKPFRIYCQRCLQYYIQSQQLIHRNTNVCEKCI